jgi:hypothetical protein
MSDGELPDLPPREWIDEPPGRIEWAGVIVFVAIGLGLIAAVLIAAIILVS